MGSSPGDRLFASGSWRATALMRRSMSSKRCSGEMCGPHILHPAVNFALAAFDRAPLTTSVAAVTGTIGISPKRFIERFKIQVGLTPKRYCRIRRFQRAVALSSRGRDVDWTRVAMDCGYFNQARRFHSRLPILLGPDADRVPVSQDVVSEPRQISTIPEAGGV